MTDEELFQAERASFKLWMSKAEEARQAAQIAQQLASERDELAARWLTLWDASFAAEVARRAG